jgi:hypothetical protein
MSAPPPGCRQRRGNCLAASQTTERHDSQKAAEMPGCGQRGKPKAGFPSPPTSPWKSALAIPTFPQPRPLPPWKSGNPKAGFPLFHSDFSNKQKTKGDQPPPRNLVLQAHLRIGICWIWANPTGVTPIFPVIAIRSILQPCGCQEELSSWLKPGFLFGRDTFRGETFRRNQQVITSVLPVPSHAIRNTLRLREQSRPHLRHSFNPERVIPACGHRSLN